MHQPAIVFVKGDVSGGDRLVTQLSSRGFGIEEVPSTQEPGCWSDFTDIVFIGSSGGGPSVELAVAERVRRRYPSASIILITDYGSEAQAIAAMRAGVNDYLNAPVALDEALATIQRNLSAEVTQSSIGSPHDAGGSAADQVLVGSSSAMRELKAYIAKVAATDAAVLISGETGTGKELAAELIHEHSARSNKPMVRVNCAAFPDDLFESELFGYERGAFTGAHSSYPGKLTLAEGGTIFFDEIGEMSRVAQAKVLRFLDSGEVFRLGAKSVVAVDVRVVAATNRNLEQLIAENRFRKDLYYRLNVGRIPLPSLKDRKEDIKELFDHFLSRMNKRCGSRVQGLCDEALACLLHYEWPGNVRELKNLLEAIFISPPAKEITLSDLPESFPGRARDRKASELGERERLIATLLATNWNKSKAAQKLHWSRMTLYRKLHKYHIE